ncbi:MAG: mercuric reductase [Gemmataceae bacterium]
MAANHYEYAIVGGGKAGKTLAMKMASAGHSTVMIERGMIGGSCINVACIPTKTLVRSAQVAELARHADRYGVRVQFEGVDPVAVRQHRDGVVAGMVGANQANFERSGMKLLLGTARFTGPRALSVALNAGGSTDITADRLLINTGTRPFQPKLSGLAEAQPLTSESIQRLDRLPEHLLVVGGGYIGCEFAQMYHRFGAKVTLLERAARFLPREDEDVAEHILGLFADDGIDVTMGAELRRVEGTSGQEVRLHLMTPDGEKSVTGSDLLVAIGRIPNTEELNLQAAGVEVDARGYVKVNEKLETTAENVWAVGDVNGGPQFTHISLDDYRIVATNLAGGRRTTRERVVPCALFIDPELGRIGLTEEEARKLGHKVRVARMPASMIPRARTRNETRGYLKAVVDADTERILGAAILAVEGGEMMAVVQVAMQAGLPYTFLRDNVFAHPSMAEALNDLFARLEA